MTSKPTFYDEKNKIWSGAKKRQLDNAELSIGIQIYNNLKNSPHHVLQISDTEGTTLTNSEALTAAIRIAQHFEKIGLGHDDFIGIVALNTTYVTPLAVACFFNCTPFHAFNPNYDEKTVREIFGLTEPKLIFCDGGAYEKIKSATQSFQPIIYTTFDHIEGVPTVLDLLDPTESESSMYRPQPLTLGADQTMALVCTSGTTGFPKSVCISNSCLNLNIEFTTSKDVIFSINPIYWIGGLWYTVFNCLYSCTRIISNKPFSTEHFMEVVHKYEVNITILFPRHAAEVIRCPTLSTDALKSLRIINIFSSFMSLAKQRTLQSIFKDTALTFGYGATEIGNIAVKFSMTNSTSVGKLVSGVRARIVDDMGRNLGPMEVGELYVDHGYSWKGYYKYPKETQAYRDSEGWFHTGDMCYFDDDNELFVLDRKSNIIKGNGFSCLPSEIENCIMEITQVVDACVFGIFEEGYGDKVAALVVKSQDSKLREQDIKDFVSRKLIAPHKQLNAGVLFVGKIPVNGNGKTLIKEAKELFLASLKNA